MFRNTGISGQFQNKPELAVLHQILSQALENRGKQMQIIWRTPGGQIFTLVVLCGFRGDPRWCLYCEQRGKRDMLFDYSSCDVMLVNNLITTNCAEASKSGKGIIGVGGKAADKQPPAQQETVENFSPEPEQKAEEPPPAKPKSSSFQPATGGQDLPFIQAGQYTPPSVTPSESGKQNLILNPRSIDGDAISKIMMSLRNPDTGMFLTPAFLYFLEQEYFRSLRSRSSLSVIHFDLREESAEDGNMVRKKLPPNAIVEAVLRITELKRHVDILAHFDNDTYAVLLPHTKAAGARTFATRMIRKLADKPLGNIDGSQLAIAVGAASIPEDFVDLSKLLGALDLTLAQSRKLRQTLVMFSDIKNSVTVPQ